LLMSHKRLAVAGYGIALVGAMGAFAVGPGKAQAPQAEQEAPRSAPRDKGVSVTVPQADVKVDGERGQLRVRAPHTAVSVDADAGRVEVRAPYVNLDVRW